MFLPLFRQYEEPETDQEENAIRCLGLLCGETVRNRGIVLIEGWNAEETAYYGASVSEDGALRPVSRFELIGYCAADRLYQGEPFFYPEDANPERFIERHREIKRED